MVNRTSVGIFNDPIEQYFNTLGNQPTLSREQEIKLFQERDAARSKLEMAVYGSIPGAQFCLDVLKGKVKTANTCNPLATFDFRRDEDGQRQYAPRGDELESLIEAIDMDLSRLRRGEERTSEALGRTLADVGFKYRILIGAFNELSNDGKGDKSALMRARRAYKRFNDILNRISLSNVALLIAIAKDYTYKPLGLDFLDILQGGFIGLKTAAVQYDLSRGVKFSAYAAVCVHHDMRRTIILDGSFVKIPFNEYSKIMRVRSALHSFDMADNMVSDEEVAAILKEHEKNIGSIRRFMMHPSSLYTPINERTMIVDTLEASEVKSLSEMMDYNSELDTTIKTILDSLPERERDVLLLRYGLQSEQDITDIRMRYRGNGWHVLPREAVTLKKVGELMSLTKERIRQIEVDAIRRLRTRKGGLERFVGS